MNRLDRRELMGRIVTSVARFFHRLFFLVALAGAVGGTAIIVGLSLQVTWAKEALPLIPVGMVMLIVGGLLSIWVRRHFFL